MCQGDTSRFIKAFFDAKEALESAQQSLRRAECDASNAESTLAKWLLPSDAAPGEKIAVWFGDALIQVEAATPPPPLSPGQDVGPGGQEAKVTVRSRGKEFIRSLNRLRS